MKKRRIDLGLLIIMLIVSFIGCASEEEKTVVKFKSVEDATEATKNLITSYNASQDKYHVEWTTLPFDDTKRFKEVKRTLQEGNRGTDALAVDVTWMGELAHGGYILPLGDYMEKGNITGGEFSPGIVEAGMYKEKQYGIPYYQNIGLLYYRSDIIQGEEAEVLASGNYTYEDLMKVAKTHMGEKGTTTGFVFQSDNYEGFIANVAEFTNGLRNIRRGLSMMNEFVHSDVTPENILGYKETETQKEFTNGKAVMARNWSYLYNLLRESDTNVISMSQVGVAPLPHGGVVGGKLLVINKHASHPDGAWDFIAYASSKEGQEILASNGYIPTRTAVILEADTQVIPNEHILKLESVQKALMTSITRPISPTYLKLSNTMQVSIHKYLRGIHTINQTIYEMDKLVKDYHIITQQTE